MCIASSPSLIGESNAAAQLQEQQRSLASSRHRLAISLARSGTLGDHRVSAPPPHVVSIKEPRRSAG